MQQEPIVSLLVDVPESLYEALKVYLEDRPDWDQDRAVTAGLSLMLLQQPFQGRSDSRHRASRIYLDTLFRRPLPAAE